MSKVNEIEDEMVGLMTDVEVEEEPEGETVPNPFSPEWNTYVLSKFDQDELDEQGNPTVDGLRRVAEILIGPIISSQVHVVAPADPRNGLRATVEFTIVINDNLLGIQRTLTDAADVYPGNVKEQMYAQFPVALATTRAEGRALRKALRLRKIVASEEITTIDPETALSEASISDAQLKQIDVISRRINVNALALLGKAKDDDGNFIENYRDIPRKTALLIIKKLNEWQRVNDVPPQFGGYVADWNNS